MGGHLAQNGLTIRPVFSLRKRTWRIPVIRELKSDDAYDVIFVVMRFTQYPTYRKLEADAQKHLKG